MPLRLGLLLLLVACRPSSPATVIIDVAQLRHALAFDDADIIGAASLSGEGLNCERFGPLPLTLSDDDTFEMTLPACQNARLFLRIDRAARADETEGVAAFIAETTSPLPAGVATTITFPAYRAGEVAVTLRGIEGERCDVELLENGELRATAELTAPADARFVLASSRTYALRCANIGNFVALDVPVAFATRTLVQLSLPLGEPEPPPPPPPMPQRVAMYGPDAAYLGQTLVFDVGVHDANVLRWRARGNELSPCGTRRACAVVAEVAGMLTVEAELDITGPEGVPVIATHELEILAGATPAVTLSATALPAMNPSSTIGGHIFFSASDPTPSGASMISTAAPPGGAVPPFSMNDGRPRCTLLIDDTACSDNRVTDATILTGDAGAIVCDQGASLASGPVLDVFVDSAQCSEVSLIELPGTDVRLRFSPTALVHINDVGGGLFVTAGGHLWVDSDVSVTNVIDTSGVPDADTSPNASADRKVFQLDAGDDKTIFVGGAIRIAPDQYVSEPWGAIIGHGFAEPPAARVIIAGNVSTSSVDFGEGTSPPGYLVIRGRQVYVPNLREIDVRGAEITAADSGTPGSGGRVSFVAESVLGAGRREEVQLHGPVPEAGDANLRIRVSAGAAEGLSVLGTSPGGQLRVVTGKPGNELDARGADGWVALFGAVDANATPTGPPSIAQAGQGGEALDLQMICDGACVASLFADLAGRGSDVALGATFTNHAGNGGNISLVQGNLAAAGTNSVSSLTHVSRSTGINLEGGDVIGAGGSFANGIEGGYGGDVSITQQFLVPGHRSRLYWSANVAARGGRCDVTAQPPSSASAQGFTGGAGGFFSVSQLQHSRADLVVAASEIDLGGGGMTYPSGAGDPLWTSVTGGTGGIFSILQTSDGTTDSAQLLGVQLLTDGGDVDVVSGDATTVVIGGDGGDANFNHSPPSSGTLSIDMTSNRTAVGGDAKNSSGSAFTTVNGGSGGDSLIDFSVAMYPMSWSLCPGTGSVGGTTSGSASVAFPGAAGTCDLPPM